MFPGKAGAMAVESGGRWLGPAWPSDGAIRKLQSSRKKENKKVSLKDNFWVTGSIPCYHMKYSS